jgi:hypothetical protein
MVVCDQRFLTGIQTKLAEYEIMTSDQICSVQCSDVEVNDDVTASYIAG